MNDLLILYNSYYQKDVIEEHLKILLDKKKVAFGKVKSKIKDQINPFEDELNAIYDKVNSDNYLQLFLSDYANLFVAKVVKVCKNALDDITPSYYKQKNLEVECFFIIEDIKELVLENFTLIKDHYLSNLTTPNYKNHSYAIYGNSYVYPLIVKQKQRFDYFKDDFLHCINIYKSKEYLKIQNEFIEYIFGYKIFALLHPDSISNVISAQIEFNQNKQNPLYDFTSIIVKYSKTLEYEIYDFCKTLFFKLSLQDKKILDLSYSVQQKPYTMSDFFTHKPNIGTMKFLLKDKLVQGLLDFECKKFVNYELLKCMDLLQNIRNNAVHEKIPSLKQTIDLKDMILGIEKFSILKALVLEKKRLNDTSCQKHKL